MASTDFEIEKREFREHYNSTLKIYEEAATSFATLILLLLSDRDQFDTPRVISRVKDREECIKKFERKYLKDLEDKKQPYEIKNHITDIIGLRIITLYETDIELVRNILSTSFHVIEESNKTANIESKDDVFGYKGFHLDLKLNDERSHLPEYKRIKHSQFEVQIRSAVQDAWSVLDHKIKYKRNIPHQLKRRINRMAALFELADQEFDNIKKETLELEKQAREPKKDIVVENNVETKNSQVDAFLFLKVMHEFFPDYEFYGYKIDGFIDELKTVNSDLTVSVLEDSLKDNSSLLEKYKSYQYKEMLNKMNPYTIVRHALYLKDKIRNKSLLFDLQRNTFNKWLENNQQKC